MRWDLPITVDIDGTEYSITKKCDYRMVLDCIYALNYEELDIGYRVESALLIFYDAFNSREDLFKLSKEQYEAAVREMLKIINNGELETDQNNEHKPQLMDWEHDFRYLAPPISRVLGYSVRDKNTYTHWYDFIGAYMEIGDCTFANIVSIRNKRLKGKKLEEHEREFYREYKKMIDLPLNLTDEEREWLDSDW